LVFGHLSRDEVLRAALDALNLFYGAPNTHTAADQKVFKSDTGELLRDAGSGRLLVAAPRVQALAGNLSGVSNVGAPGIGVKNLRSGVLVATSLDGLPLTQSRNFLIKM